MNRVKFWGPNLLSAIQTCPQSLVMLQLYFLAALSAQCNGRSHHQGLTDRVFQLRVGSGSGIGKIYWVGSGSGSGSGIGNIY